MPIRVVAISHTDGAGGERIGRIVSERLGFRYVDEEIIRIAADKEGLDYDLIADAEKRKSLLARLVQGLGRVGVAGAGIGAVTIRDAPEAIRSANFQALILDAIRETAERGDVVIVAHAASIAIADRKDLLRILITAPVKARSRRIAEAAHIPEEEAATSIQRSDARRAQYIRRFHDIDTELPTHYDLVVNTDRLSLDQASEIVIRALQ
jgi:cytidylate kinase